MDSVIKFFLWEEMVVVRGINPARLCRLTVHEHTHTLGSCYSMCILKWDYVNNNIRIIELAQLSCIWTEVLQITNLMLSCRGVYSPARRAPLRGERHWRGAAAAQNKHYVMMSLLINYYFLHFCLFLNFNFYFLICFKLFFFIDTPVGRSFILL